MGNDLAVYISDYDLLKGALSKDEFSGRPNFEGFNFIRGGQVENDSSTPGVIMGWGQKWLNIRRFSLRCLARESDFTRYLLTIC